MMEGWNEYRLDDFAKVVMGLSPSGETYNEEQIGKPLLNGPTEFGNTYPNCTLYTTDPKRICDTNDLIFCVRGSTTGRMNWADKPYSLGRGVCSIRGKDDLTTKFIKHLLSVNLEGLLQITGGGTFPNLKKEDINGFTFKAPIEYRKIAKILSAYDDLIENNLKRIKLLEEMAQNQFNEWYANNEDFEEVNLSSIIGHEIGGGWGAEEQSDEFIKPAYVIRGTDIDELPNGKLEKVPFRFHKKSNLASRKLQDGDIIFEVSGGSSYEGVAKTLLVTDELLKQFDNAVMPASFCKLARPIERKYSIFLFLFWRFLRNIKGTEVFEIRSASNIVNYNWTAFLKFQKIKKPSENELKKFNEVVEPIYKQVYNLGNQNQRLKEARDILLPRLMTGMIDVSEIDTELSMAAEDGVEYGKI